MKNVKVENMISTNSYNNVPNQFIITTDDGQYFQSYQSVIAFIPAGHPYREGDKIVLDKKYWNYSRTTAKYRNQFLGETTKETQAKIDSGEYLLADLNK